MANNNLQNSANPPLSTKELKDAYVRKNFQNLVDYFNKENQMLGFRFMEVVTTQAVTNKLFAHGLGSTPQDVFVTKAIGASFTFNYGLFDSSNINITTSGAARIRFYVGTYWNYQSSVTPQKTDSQTYGGTSSVSSGGASVVVTASYSMLTGNFVVLANASTGAITVYLPLVSAALGLGVYQVVKTDSSANAVTVSVKTASSDYFNNSGLTTLTLPNQGNSLMVAPNTTSWTTLAYNRPSTKKILTSTNTYQRPSGCTKIVVSVIGGGGGGGGGGSTVGGAGGTGGGTTFGTSLLTGSGGIGGAPGGTFTGGLGGAASLGTGPVGTATTGNPGASSEGGTGSSTGANGGVSFLGGGGRGTPAGSGAGIAAQANSGSGGGGGGGAGANVAGGGGAGGGAGGSVIVTIQNPLPSYAYVIGAGGTAGTTGTSGGAGGVGGSGVIIVEEFYS